MVVNQIYPTSRFVKSYRKLPEKIRTVAKEREKIFINDPLDKRLKTHKLKGRLKSYWSYSINYQYRIMFRFVDKDTVIYYDVGTYDVYK